jgi:hypothetical protein
MTIIDGLYKVSLRHVSDLLSLFNERLAGTCFASDPRRPLIEKWGGPSLHLWRWGSVVQTCEAVLERRPALLDRWDSDAFSLGALGKCPDDTDEPSFKKQQVDRQFVSACDRAIKSDRFWAYAHMLLAINGFVEWISSWTEGCYCHSDVLCGQPTFRRRQKAMAAETGSKKCILKGRRAPELAAGALRTTFEKMVANSSALLSRLLSNLHTEEDRAQLAADYHSAMDTMSLHLQTKTAHWQSLPWLCAGMAHPDEDIARRVAGDCLRTFAATAGPGARHHPLTLRLLQGELRDSVEQFWYGARRESLGSLRTWLGGLRLLRVSERETEARHETTRTGIWEMGFSKTSWL